MMSIEEGYLAVAQMFNEPSHHTMFEAMQTQTFSLHAPWQRVSTDLTHKSRRGIPIKTQTSMSSHISYLYE